MAGSAARRAITTRASGSHLGSFGANAHLLLRVRSHHAGWARTSPASDSSTRHQGCRGTSSMPGHCWVKKSIGSPRWACAIDDALKSSWWTPLARNAQRSRQ